jgi:NADH:ubiquinone oxidoreductase subunit E
MKTSVLREHRPLEITVCMGSSCFSRGNNRSVELIQHFLEDRGLPATIELAGHLCEGQCKAGPNITINGVAYPGSVPDSVINLLKRHLPEDNPWTT